MHPQMHLQMYLQIYLEMHLQVHVQGSYSFFSSMDCVLCPSHSALPIIPQGWPPLVLVSSTEALQNKYSFAFTENDWN